MKNFTYEFQKQLDKLFESAWLILKPGTKIKKNFIKEIFYPVLAEYSNKASKYTSNFMELITPKEIIEYIIWEHKFNIEILDDQKRVALQKSEVYKNTIINSVLEKLLVLGHANFEFSSMTSKFSPEISTLDIYINLLIETIQILDLSPEYTISPIDDQTYVNVIASLFGKCFRVIKSALTLFSNGCESEALSLLRTLLEYECTIKILLDYGIKNTNVFISFIHHSIYQNNNTLGEETIHYLEKEYKDFNAKPSNDFINYGWLKHIDKKMPLNVTDGLLNLSGYSEYREFYTIGSKNIHSSGSILFEHKQEIYFQAIGNLYFIAKDNFNSFNQYLQHFFPQTWVEKEKYYNFYTDRIHQVFTELEKKFNYLKGF
jgi:Family of unknown function (DUF5677)